MKFSDLFLSLIFLSFFQAEALEAEVIGLIGGEYNSSSNQPYAALIDANGAVTRLSDLPLHGGIRSVAMNSKGVSLIGGEDSHSGIAAYGALVGPSGNVMHFLGLPSQGVINSVSINESGTGLIGGINTTSGGAMYAAFVASSGALTEISGLPTDGTISSVVVNENGIGLIGGQENVSFFPNPYAALVVPNGTLTALSGLPTQGAISSVAINRKGIGLIGGEDASAGLAAYAAFIGPSGAVMPLSGLPGNGIIHSVALNQSGIGLVGGEETSSSNAYAAFIAPNGIVTPIAGLPSAGAIFSVAINETGAGIIGGEDASAGPSAYAALVAPNGAITTLLGLPAFGGINSVVITASGAGLIGGENSSSLASYAALVAPDGTVTLLPGLVSDGSINSVALLDAITPAFAGSSWGAVNTQLSAAFALEAHLSTKVPKESRISKQNKNLSLLAWGKKGVPIQPETITPKTPQTIWLSPFGNYVHQKAQGNNPLAENSIGGVLLGYDYSYPDLLFGGTLGYAYNHIHYGTSIGHGHVQEEMASFYGAYEQKWLRINFSVWGGVYQLYNKRNYLFSFSSISHTHGWILSPHFELGTPVPITSNLGYFIEPFVMFDWVNNWQSRYKEKGSSGLNLVVDGHYSSVMRSEAGLRFFEEYSLNAGKFLFKQKVSYINQSPFNFDRVTTSFVASASTFPVAIGNSHVQNLGGVELSSSFVPKNVKYPYLTLDFQGEFGSSFQSYFGSLEIGKKF